MIGLGLPQAYSSPNALKLVARPSLAVDGSLRQSQSPRRLMKCHSDQSPRPFAASRPQPGLERQELPDQLVVDPIEW